MKTVEEPNFPTIFSSNISSESLFLLLWLLQWTLPAPTLNTYQIILTYML